MNTLVAAHDFYPDPGSGGTGRYVYETARRLADRGHAISVITRRRGDVPRRSTVDGIDVYRYDLQVAERSGLAVLADLPVAIRRIREVTDAINPELVSFQGPLTATLTDAVVDAGIPRSCTFHSPWPTEYLIRTRGDRSAPRRWVNATLRERIEALLLDRAGAILTLSSFMQERLVHRYNPDSETAVVPGGVDSERFEPDAGEYPPMDQTGPAFLTVRRLSPRMGHGLLLAAFARVRDRHPNAELYIVGDGPLRDQLETRAENLGVSQQTTFLGYVPDEDLPKVYASADIFVLPTTELEGFGLATLESLAAQTPVIGTPVGGTPELLAECQDRPGIPERMLATAATPEAVAERMAAWAALSPPNLAQAGRICRQYVRDTYTWESTVDVLERRYRILAGQTDGRRPVTGDIPSSVPSQSS